MTSRAALALLKEATADWLDDESPRLGADATREASRSAARTTASKAG